MLLGLLLSLDSSWYEIIKHLYPNSYLYDAETHFTVWPCGQFQIISPFSSNRRWTAEKGLLGCTRSKNAFYQAYFSSVVSNLTFERDSSPFPPIINKCYFLPKDVVTHPAACLVSEFTPSRPSFLFTYFFFYLFIHLKTSPLHIYWPSLYPLSLYPHDCIRSIYP